MKNIQAFPNDMHPSNDPDNNYRGMTLRDYFAGQVLTGFMSQHALRFDSIDDANYCYKIADAMLKEREK